MRVFFSPQGWEDYLYRQQTDKKLVRKINELIRDTLRDPHQGIGKPEPLKHAYSGWWSRRITPEHRMVYRIVEDGLEIAQLRGHYEGQP
jgi:toxin YoeB